MVTRETLHRLIDALPDDALPAAERAIARLQPLSPDLPRVLAEAPLDDEEETDEERALVAEACEDLERGNVISDHDLRRELGW